MRLIDADKLDVVLRNEAKPFGHGAYEFGITDGLALARECVETAPSIDAAPVVRCRECQKWEKKYELDNGQVFGACDRFYGAVTEDSFFCRDGQ